MEFGLSNEHRMIRRTIREFRDNEMRPLVENLDPEATHLPKKQEKELREKAKEQGLWAMGIPEEYGGGGLDILGRAIVLEELVQHKLGMYNPSLGAVEIAPGVTVGSPEVYLETATDYHMEEFIQPAIEGDRKGCFALTEPSGGSDPTTMKTRAVKDGDEWVINGEKRFITAGGYSDFAALFARAIVDGEDKGITAFLVDAENEGWNVHRRIDVIRPKDPFEIHMDDMRVSDRNRFGPIGGGLELASSGVRTSRIGYSATHIGIAKYALEMAIDYAKER